MAYLYKVYTLKKGIPYHVSYDCEFCGAHNELIHLANAKASYDTKGRFGNPIEKRRGAALTELSDNATEMERKISSEADQRDYHTIRVRCHCKQCGKIPAWAFPGGLWVQVIQKVKTVSLYGGLIVFLFLLSALWGKEKSLQDFLPALYVLLPAVIYYVVGLVYMLRQKMRMKKLEDRFLPLIHSVKESESALSRERGNAK